MEQALLSLWKGRKEDGKGVLNVGEGGRTTGIFDQGGSSGAGEGEGLGSVLWEGSSVARFMNVMKKVTKDIV